MSRHNSGRTDKRQPEYNKDGVWSLWFPPFTCSETFFRIRFPGRTLKLDHLDKQHRYTSGKRNFHIYVQVKSRFDFEIYNRNESVLFLPQQFTQRFSFQQLQSTLVSKASIIPGLISTVLVNHMCPPYCAWLYDLEAGNFFCSKEHFSKAQMTQ